MPRDVDVSCAYTLVGAARCRPNVLSSAAWPVVSPGIEPDFHDTGPEIILDLGFWILDQFSFCSFCGGPKRLRLDFGFWSLDFGVWILEFGFWIVDFGFKILDFGFGLGLLETVWILHKIFPCHADSGRRIFGT